MKLRKTFRPQSSKDYTENNRIQRFNKYTVEALLQHYIGKTRFLDVVDNHWIALWMGLQQFHMHGKSNEYCKCIKRSLSIGESLEHLYTKHFLPNDYIYLYVMLVAMPHAISKPMFGITETESFVEVDLRKALPSFYLRPHAQHALVVRRLDKHNERADAEYYDMANQVVGILRVRIDIADEWLGHGKLMTQENIFPSPSVDQGYNTLLMKNEIFTHPYQIVKYF